ncbi:MAG: GNAT family N-acetyltransferase [Fusobacteriaceae bacterium]
MDKNIKKIKLIMLKEDMIYEEYPLLEGYEFIPYSLGLAEKWSEIQLKSGHILKKEDGEKYFKDIFFKKEEYLKERMIFIKKLNGDIVGTGAIWEGEYFQKKKEKNIEYRLHWIAIDSKYSGKGLGTALVSKLLGIFKEKKIGKKIYLSTQTYNYAAIKIYLKFGFLPYKNLENKIDI